MALEDLFGKPPTAPDLREILSLAQLLQQSQGRPWSSSGITPSDTGESPTGGGTFPKLVGGAAAGAVEPGAQRTSGALTPSWLDAQYAAADKANNLPVGTMKGFGFIESTHNPNAHTAGSQYKGLMQLGSSESKGINPYD